MKYTVLVVDDDEEDFMLLNYQIQTCHQDIVLLAAQDATQAIRQLSEGVLPSLIIITPNLPIVKGYELVVWLMESVAWRHLPIVVWTDEMSEQEVAHYYRVGANSVRLKRDILADIETFCQDWFKAGSATATGL